MNPSCHQKPAPHRRIAAPFAAWLSLAALLTPTLSPAREEQVGFAELAEQHPIGFADLVEHQMNTVVNIATLQKVPAAEASPDAENDIPPGSHFEEFFREFHGDQPSSPHRIAARGSGIIMDSDGLIVTNHHVVEAADEIKVILHDETQLNAELVGSDEMTDLALLQVRGPNKLPAAEWGDSDALRIGDWVMAIGNPFGLGGSVTTGILSARARDIQQGPYDEFLQTDASINQGNSGGPLFDTTGRVIGINTAIFSPTGGSVGIGFAIPSALARPVIEQIRTHGRARRGWLGVQIQPVTPDIAETLGRDGAHGALVTGVTEGSPAEAGGLRRGDMILSFAGREIGEAHRLPRAVADTPIGQLVDMEVLSRGEIRSMEIRVGDMDDSLAAEVAGIEDPDLSELSPPSREFGLTLAPLSDELRAMFAIPDAVTDGVVITDLAPDSPAVEQDLAVGDVIVEIDRQPVGDPDDLAGRIETARREGKRNLLMLLNRQGDLRYVPLPLDGNGG
jgi:serine protease Do